MGTSSATRRLEGVQDALQGAPISMHVVSSDWSSSGGEQAMKQWLQVFHGGSFPRFMVGAQNDAMALGARNALEADTRANAALPREIRFTGCDGTPAVGRRVVTEGRLTATVVIPATTGRAVSELASMLSGGQRPLADIALGVSSLPDLSELAALGHADEKEASSSPRIRTAQVRRSVAPAKK
jgi:ABC-type sugar transport system substrate-binding protein